MNRLDFVLAALSSPGDIIRYRPVQVQKLFFVIDRELGVAAGGPYFNFRPYDYGPFDRQVYEDLETLNAQGLAHIWNAERSRSYSLTQIGLAKGKELFGQLSPEIRGYISSLVEWMRPLTFPQLVSAVYKRYPDMKAASVFRE